MPKIFISHAWEDNEISKELAEHLKRDGAEIWIDYARIRSGDPIPEEIGRGIEWCETMVLVWSRFAKNSKYVNLEWNCAINEEKRVIVCIMDNTKLPTILRSFLHLDFREFEKIYKKLAHDLGLKIKEEMHVAPGRIESKKEKQKEAAPSPAALLSDKMLPLRRTLELRSQAERLSVDTVKADVKSHGFFDSARNPEGSGIRHQYEFKVIEREKIVIDHVTGLMWQQGGSLEYMNYETAKRWIETLNRKGYAGYHDWRFPTLEEAMSLMEREKKKGDLFIDPVFDGTQWWIWTSDLTPDRSWAWVVYFDRGRCTHGHFAYDSSVRAVRSGE